MWYKYVAHWGCQIALSRRGQAAPLLGPGTHMLNDDVSEHGVFVCGWDCADLGRLFSELSDTVGMLLPMLQLASMPEGGRKARATAMALETCARASLVTKKLLWKWSGLCGWANEETGLRSRAELLMQMRVERRRFKKEARLTKHGRGISQPVRG